jgi:acyl carrier protein
MSARGAAIRKFTAEHFKSKAGDGSLTATLRDLRMDSLELVEFLMRLEEKFGIEVNVNEIHLDMTLEKVCEVVDSHR